MLIAERVWPIFGRFWEYFRGEALAKKSIDSFRGYLRSMNVTEPIALSLVPAVRLHQGIGDVVSLPQEVMIDSGPQWSPGMAASLTSTFSSFVFPCGADLGKDFGRAAPTIHYTTVKDDAGPGVVYVDHKALDQEVQKLCNTLGVSANSPTAHAWLGGTVRLEAVLATLDRRETLPLNGHRLSLLTSQLFPRAEGYTDQFCAHVQLIVCKARLRLKWGLSALVVPIDDDLLTPTRYPGIRYLNRVCQHLGISQASLLRVMGIQPQRICGYFRGTPFPLSLLQKLLNVLETPDASAITYFFYQPYLDPFFERVVREGTMILRTKRAIRPVDQLRKYGFGGLLRAHRVTRGMSVPRFLADPSLEVFGPMMIRRIECNRDLPRSILTSMKLVNFFDMGPEGIIALMPDLPRLIRILHGDRGNKLLERPQSSIYELTEYQPERVRTEGSKKDQRGGAVREGGISEMGRLGHYVTFARVFRGWSQVEMERITGLPRPVLCSLESDEARPTLSTCEILAQSLGDDLAFIAYLANQTPYRGQKIYKGEEIPDVRILQASRPCLFDPGDAERLRIYLAHYGKGAKQGPSFGEVLFFLRKDLNRLKMDSQLRLTHIETADLLDIEGGRYTGYELNRRPPIPHELRRIATYFGVDLKLLVQATLCTDYPAGTKIPDYS